MFLNTDSKLLNLGILRKLCKNCNIPKYSQLNKQELMVLLNKYHSTRIIQYHYRKHLYKNAVDHITLDKVSYPCFIFRTKYGKCYFYSYESIINYIMKTGDTRDPMTRIQYHDELLINLDSSAKKHLPGVKLKSTVKIKNNPEYARRIKNRLNEILSYQTRLSELRILLTNFIESGLAFINIDNIFIDNIEYLNSTTYLNTVIYEIKIRIRNLGILDSYSSEFFKSELSSVLDGLLIDEYSQEKKNKINEIINLINS